MDCGIQMIPPKLAFISNGDTKFVGLILPRFTSLWLLFLHIYSCLASWTIFLCCFFWLGFSLSSNTSFTIKCVFFSFSLVLFQLHLWTHGHLMVQNRPTQKVDVYGATSGWLPLGWNWEHPGASCCISPVIFVFEKTQHAFLEKMATKSPKRNELAANWFPKRICL